MKYAQTKSCYGCTPMVMTVVICLTFICLFYFTPKFPQTTLIYLQTSQKSEVQHHHVSSEMAHSDNGEVDTTSTQVPTCSFDDQGDGERPVWAHSKSQVVTWWLQKTQERALESGDCTDDNYRKALQYFFGPTITVEEKKNLLETMKACLNIAEMVGVDYFLHAGTLLGYVRHNGSLIPWDEDADIAIVADGNDESEFDEIVKSFEKAAAEIENYGIHYAKSYRRVKCFGTSDENSVKIQSKLPWVTWRWPYIDFQFMVRTNISQFGEDYDGDESGIEEVGDHIVNEIADLRKFPNQVIYPLKSVTFSELNMDVNVPQLSYEYLLRNYGVENLDRCGFSKGGIAWDHRSEKIVTQPVVVPCDDLKFFIPITNNL